jgi:polypeptide N-acetylgalactosaminyltransferase
MDFVGRNLKRVAEVWLDDYKKYFYRGDQKRYDKIDPGDLTAQFEKKKSLNCKPFKHYIDVVAPDMLMRYPIDPQHFAAGSIQSQSTLKCLGMPKSNYDDPIGLVDCTKSGGNDFILTLEKSFKYNDTNDQCLNSKKLTFSNCHHQVCIYKKEIVQF